MANNYYMQKQAAWQTAAEDALTKQAAGLADIQRQAVEFMQKNPELVGSLLGGTAGAGLGALTAPEDENGEVSTAKRLLYALGGGALGAGAGAAAPSAKAWLDKWLAERKGGAVPPLDHAKPEFSPKEISAPQQEVDTPTPDKANAPAPEVSEAPNVTGDEKTEPNNNDPLPGAAKALKGTAISRAIAKAKALNRAAKEESARRRSNLSDKIHTAARGVAGAADAAVSEAKARNQEKEVRKQYAEASKSDTPASRAYKAMKNEKSIAAPDADISPSFPGVTDDAGAINEAYLRDMAKRGAAEVQDIPEFTGPMTNSERASAMVQAGSQRIAQTKREKQLRENKVLADKLYTARTANQAARNKELADWTSKADAAAAKAQNPLGGVSQLPEDMRRTLMLNQQAEQAKQNLQKLRTGGYWGKVKNAIGL